jgi:hypothetical protein
MRRWETEAAQGVFSKLTPFKFNDDVDVIA